MKLPRMAMAVLALFLSGCQHRMSVEEARAECAKQGGLLVVIYTQKITLAGVGKEMESPGDCVPSKALDLPAPTTGALPIPSTGPGL